ncbi:DUF4386 domain-containing protein [Massilia antarctica]|uniref:DUF4386 domain-containing protein n=1 Tax=Massilia antarctica TaxID=2765360 RepID=UPI0006BB6B2F|nr:DUF4386 domain-containing protein [Massilia sp. H27-R4]MCY0910629.1 DUF4386 domain-containing protein [Massilia sp. H27-R4]CUI09007.1 Sll7047 protein [Janthinobacterium sp. CG23_2]CUU32793.1 Sll7047 protein [Janthinobacterium sp. CG23_2]
MPDQHQTELGGKDARRTARIAGALYLVIIVIGLLGETLIRNSLVVAGNAAETARRIVASEWLWRLGIAGQLLLLLCAVALSLAWYVLLRPVNRKLTLLAMFFALVSLAVESVSALQLQGALTPLLAGAHLGMDGPQAQAAAYLAIVGHSYAFAVALMFFGAECLIVGHLIRKSGYFPAAVGAMMQLAGLCYLVNTFIMVLSPALHGAVFPAILVPSFLGESAFCLCLLFKGINIPAWERMTAPAPSLIFH